MIVFKYFLKKMDIFGPLMDKKEQNEEQKTENKYKSLTRALILALSVCYNARLRKRDEYEWQVSLKFTKPLLLLGGVKQFRNEIRL